MCSPMNANRNAWSGIDARFPETVGRRRTLDQRPKLDLEPQDNRRAAG